MAASGSGQNLEEMIEGVKLFGLNTSKAVDFSSAPSVALPGGTTTAGAQTITSTSANAFAVGANGATNPVLAVDASATNVATGLLVQGQATGFSTKLVVTDSGSNANLIIDAKGTGTVSVGTDSSGNVILANKNGVTAGGSTQGVQIGNGGPLIYVGSGAPTISATVKGSIYLRTDGSSTSTRMYVATDTAGTWTAVTTAA